MTRQDGHCVRRLVPSRAARFVFLSCAFFVVIGLMAFAEGIVFWLLGNDVKGKSALQKVSVGDFSVSANGEWAVSRVSVSRKGHGPMVRDVVLHNLRDQTAVCLNVSRYRPLSVAVSPTGDTVAITCEDGAIHVGNASPGREARFSVDRARWRPFARASEGPYRLAFSPDGRLLAATGRHFTRVWRWPDGKPLQKWPHKGLETKFLSFSDDSRRVLLPGPRREVLLCDAYTGQIVRVMRVVSPEDCYVLDAALSRDSRLAAVADSSRRLRVYSLVDNEELWCQSTSGPSIALSRDGRFVASHGYVAGTGWHRIRVYDGSSGEHVCELSGHDRPIIRIAFASDGLLYSWDIGGVIRAWNIEDRREQWCFSTLAWASDNRCFH